MQVCYNYSLFDSLYQVEDKMNQFYHLLVKEALDNEDVAALAKDNVKDCHEVLGQTLNLMTNFVDNF